MTITLEIIDGPNGETVVLPSPESIQASAARCTAKADESESEAAGKPEPDRAAAMAVVNFLRHQAQELVDFDRRLREKFPVRKLTFESSGYTYGQAKKAKSAATTWRDGKPFFDDDAYEDALVAIALGKDVAWVDDLHPAVAVALRRAVREQGEPSREKLDFLSFAPISSPSTGD